MASRMEWHLPVQEEVDWLRLFLFENKVENIAKRATRMHSTNLIHFYPTTPAKLGSARPNTDCLAASNGVCTKRNTARFELLPSKNKVNNSSQTWPLIHLRSLATFSSKILLLKWVMPVKEYYGYEARWIWTKWQISVLGDIHILPPFYLILTRLPDFIYRVFQTKKLQHYINYKHHSFHRDII